MSVNPKELWQKDLAEETKPSVTLAKLVEFQRPEKPERQPSYRSKYAPEPLWTVCNGNWGKRTG